MKIEPKLHLIDAGLHKFEAKCNKHSVIPGVGLVLGTAKILTGTLQMVTAFVVTLLLAIPLCTIGRSFLKWTASHMAHGFGNIVSGTIEAIPFVAMVYRFTLIKINESREKKFFDGELSENEKNVQIYQAIMKVMAYETYSHDISTKYEAKSPIKGLLFTL